MAEEKKEEKFEKLTRRELLAGTGGFAAGMALGSGGASLLLPPKEVIKTVEVPKIIEVPKEVEVVKEVEVIKTVEVPTEVEVVKGVEVPRYVCPYCDGTFSTPGALRAHVDSEHAPKPPSERVGRPPYIYEVDWPTYDRFVVGPVERFDQKNEVFSRSTWDEEYQKRRAAAPVIEVDEMEALEGEAFRAGAIYVDDKAGSDAPNYYGYQGHQTGFGGLYDWEEPVNEKKFPVTDPAEMSERIKRVAKFYGADLVGICELDQRWVYSNYFDRVTGQSGELDIPHKYAIVIAVEMDLEGIKTSPGHGASAATARGYSNMAEVAPSLAKYIRSLGYPAIPCGNDTVQSIPVAIDAGLGELGRLGLLITPEFGPRVRLCKVLTDLPLKTDKPIEFKFSMQNFCESCILCALACPVEAVPFGERTTEPTSISNRTGILRWPVNVEKCYTFWRMNRTDCSNCIAACPWTDLGEHPGWTG